MTLVNVTPEAVANCTENVRRLGLEGACQVVQSDMFAALPPQQQFDVMLFNMPVIEFDVAHASRACSAPRFPFPTRSPIPDIKSFAGSSPARRGPSEDLVASSFVPSATMEIARCSTRLGPSGLVARRVHRLINHAHINEYQVLRVERQD